MKNELADEPETAIHRMVAAARDGREPRVVGRLFSGWVLFGERQFLRGYTLLLPDPVVPTLNALGSKERTQYLQDVVRLGDAVMKVTGAARINYAILGNQEPALHTHVIPRYANEPDTLKTLHPWAYNWDEAPLFDRATYRELAENLARELTKMGVTKPMRFEPGANLGSPAMGGSKPATGPVPTSTPQPTSTPRPTAGAVPVKPTPGVPPGAIPAKPAVGSGEQAA